MVTAISLLELASYSTAQVHSHVSTAVELESGLETNNALDIALRVQLAEGFLGGIQTIDIGLVVLGVVEGHDLGRDGWLERLESENFATKPQSTKRYCHDSHRKRMARMAECAWFEQT